MASGGIKFVSAILEVGVGGGKRGADGRELEEIHGMIHAVVREGFSGFCGETVPAGLIRRIRQGVLALLGKVGGEGAGEGEGEGERERPAWVSVEARAVADVPHVKKSGGGGEEGEEVWEERITQRGRFGSASVAETAALRSELFLYRFRDRENEGEENEEEAAGEGEDGGWNGGTRGGVLEEGEKEEQTMEELETQQLLRSALREYRLPSGELNGLWEGLVLSGSSEEDHDGNRGRESEDQELTAAESEEEARKRDIKGSVLSYLASVVLFTEQRVDTTILGWNRLLLLVGPPGTGKTTLSRAIGQKVGVRYPQLDARLVDVNLCSLFSKYFSESSSRVGRVFGELEAFATARADAFLIVILDEVESISASRSRAISSSEPSDAVRVVNSLLLQLDRLQRLPNVLCLGTSNITSAIDPALLDRADMILRIPKPPLPTRYELLGRAVAEMMRSGLLAPSCSFLDFPTASLFGSRLVQEHFSGSASMDVVSAWLLRAAELSRGSSGRSLRRLPLVAHIHCLQRPHRRLGGTPVDTLIFLRALLTLTYQPTLNRAAINEALDALALAPHHWSCGSISATALTAGVALHQLVCNGTSQTLRPDAGGPGFSQVDLSNVEIQVAIADLTANGGLSIQPVVAQSNYPPEASPYRQTVLGMADWQSQQGKSPIAGVNGGYFWFSPQDPKGLFFDSNCAAKDYLNFVNRSSYTTFDLGDGITVIDGQVFSWNCPTLGPHDADQPQRAAVLHTAAGLSIANLPAGPFNYSAMGIDMALGCGPMLIQNGSVAMQWQEIPSTFEYSAYTGFALASSLSDQHQLGVFITCNGKDGQQGLHAWDLANFLLEMLPKLFKARVHSALSFDQGGSTTMVIRNPVTLQNELITSSGDDRSVFNALFLFEH